MRTYSYRILILSMIFDQKNKEANTYTYLLPPPQKKQKKKKEAKAHCSCYVLLSCQIILDIPSSERNQKAQVIRLILIRSMRPCPPPRKKQIPYLKLLYIHIYMDIYLEHVVVTRPCLSFVCVYVCVYMYVLRPSSTSLFSFRCVG